MTSLWPWLAVAGAGALHGLNPCTGWLLAAGCGVRAPDGRPLGHVLRALVPIGIGHVVSVGAVAALVVAGLPFARWPMQGVFAAMLLVTVGLRLSRRASAAWRAPAGRGAMVLWSCIVSTAQGSGMMLVPALVPLCVGDSPAREITASGSVWLALAAVGVHAGAMLGVTALVASGVVRGVGVVGRDARWLRGRGAVAKCVAE